MALVFIGTAEFASDKLTDNDPPIPGKSLGQNPYITILFFDNQAQTVEFLYLVHIY